MPCCTSSFSGFSLNGYLRKLHMVTWMSHWLCPGVMGCFPPLAQGLVRQGMSTEAKHSFSVFPQLYHFHSCVQHEEYLASFVDQVHHYGMSVSHNLAEEGAAAAENKALQTFGSCSETIPCIRQVALSVHNVPMAEVGSNASQITWTFHSFFVILIIHL